MKMKRRRERKRRRNRYLDEAAGEQQGTGVAP